MENNHVYRVYSFRSRKFLRAKTNRLCMSVRAVGEDNSKKTKITAVEDAFSPKFVCYYLVFARKKQDYVLYVDDNNNFKLKPFNEKMKAEKDRSALFIPEMFSPPFRAFKLTKPGLEDYCIAANEKGRLSVRKFNREMPDPETIFVVATVA